MRLIVLTMRMFCCIGSLRIELLDQHGARYRPGRYQLVLKLGYGENATMPPGADVIVQPQSVRPVGSEVEVHEAARRCQVVPVPPARWAIRRRHRPVHTLSALPGKK